MKIVYQAKAQEDVMYWFDTDKKILGKIFNLIKQTVRTPFEGDGKPHALKHNLTGCWSRSINSEHRFVYTIYENEDDSFLEILSCRGHYTDL